MTEPTDDLSSFLRKERSEKTLRGNFFGKGGALHIAKSVFRQECKMGRGKQGLIPLASTFYAAAGNVKSKAHQQRNLFYKFFMLIFAYWLLLRAHGFGRRREKFGLQTMSDAELDVWSSILLKFKESDKAEKCFKEVLSRTNVQPHTRALVTANLALLRDRQGYHDEAHKLYGDILTMTESPTFHALTRVRIRRSLGSHYLLVGEKEKACREFTKALAMAKSNSFTDQIAKLEPLIKKCSSG